MARKAKPKDEKKSNGANLGFESELWRAADALRSNMDAAEYKHVVLGLIFLKYISDAFEEKHSELLKEKDKGADPEDKDEYKAVNIFWVPKEARWSKLKANAKQATIGKEIDDAMLAIERDNSTLKGVLPKDYAHPRLDKQRLGQLIDLVGNIGLGDIENRSKDILGRVYEYFLSQFASAEGKKGGQFYTPRCIVRLLVEMLAPFKGRVYDPCCGSGGMFVQSEKFVEAHGGRIGDISIYGQESNHTTWRLAKMNLAIRGIDGNLGKEHADSFHHDLHPDLRADFVLANPPFNDSDWRGDLLKEDKRWKFGIPPAGNANYAWVQHFIYHLTPTGITGFVLANGSMSSNQSGEGDIRKNIIEADMVDCMVALPGQLFYSTQIPVCLWFISREKKNGRFRDRRGETLFIDARKMGSMIDRVHRELTEDDINKIADTYHAWRGDPHPDYGHPLPTSDNPHPASSHPLPEGEGNYRGGASFSSLVETARELRKSQTPAELILWEMLRDRKFLDLKFRRQHQYGTYVLDFYCDELKLVVELDGPVHKDREQKERDKARDEWLKEQGLYVLRFANEAVLSDLETVLNQIQSHVPLPSGKRCGGDVPSPTGRGDNNDLPSPPGKTGDNDLPSPFGRGDGGEGSYRDVPGFCKSATVEEIKRNGYVLTPGRYVGAEAVEEDDEPFEEKMKRLTDLLNQQMAEGRKLDAAIEENLKELGFGK